MIRKLLKIGDVVEDNGKTLKVVVRFGGEKYVYTIDKEKNRVIIKEKAKRDKFYQI